MKKLFISMFVAVVAFTLWSCGPANTPSAVAEEACKCVQNEDYEGYVELMDLKETKNQESEKQQFVALQILSVDSPRKSVSQISSCNGTLFKIIV